jgi:hypothetical protein
MNKLPEATQQALHYLLQTASAEGVVLAGFALKADPAAITNFGNCPDKADLKLYEALCKVVDEKQKAGLVILDNVQKPS